ncbi:MAG: TonB-dependent receptor [Ignavibacteriae bacterium]|nr:MAG: TonB-dependent receptor [Ignavibacteriota bacterium]
MKMKSIKLYLILISLYFFLAANIIYSQSVKGTVYGEADNKKEKLEDAIVKWMGTTKGTITDGNGNFEISLTGITEKKLVVTYSGFKTDTVEADGSNDLEIVLQSNTTTGTIEITDDKNSTYFGNYEAKTEIITSQELVKDACCDLAGCFGRNSSVEVAVTDILTDSKELKILGLEGAYTQILIDNMPLMNGLNVKYGVSSIPGTLIDKITISKGSNSVLQGYESISGIMNVLLKDYDVSDRLLINGFVNSMLEKQMNMNLTHSFNEKLNTILTFHSIQKSNRIDDNSDGFLDNPLVTRYVAYNKWKFSDKKNKTDFNIAGRLWNEERIGGQKNFNIKSDEGSNKIYGQTVNINSIEGYSRFSKQFSDENGMKLYLSSSYYDQKSFYGITQYSAKQENFSVSGFYEFDVLGSSMKTGASYKYLNIDETVKFTGSTNKTYAGNYVKKESIPGVFAENSFRFLNDKASLLTGIRLDYHNEHKLIVTPRVLFRYQPDELLVIRASIGTGFRTVNLLSENTNILASAKDIVIENGLKPERILNYGADLLYYFSFGKIGGNLNVDFYRTDFYSKVIPDFDSDPGKVIFTNLDGKAFSNVFQAEANINIYSNFDLKLAYKLVDQKYDLNGKRYDQPFNSKHRILSTISYAPKSNSWSASAGLQWFGKQRLPSTSANPVEYQLPEESEPYILMNAQLNKNFDKFEIYAGVENLLNFKQDNPIISAENPFGQYFDTSLNWGPTKGREYYAGFRFLLK